MGRGYAYRGEKNSYHNVARTGMNERSCGHSVITQFLGGIHYYFLTAAKFVDDERSHKQRKIRNTAYTR